MVALKHGGRRLLDGEGSALDEARRVEIREAIVADLGGEREVSTVLLLLVEDFAAAVLVRDACWRHVQAVGPFTAHGKRRAAVDLWREASVRVERLAARIGTERRAAPVASLEVELARIRDQQQAGATRPGDINHKELERRRRELEATQ